MDNSRFISSRLKFRSRLATWAIGISSFIMVISTAISAGFRHEIRKGIATISGDIQMCSVHQNWYSDTDPIHSRPSYIDMISGARGVRSVDAVIYRAGIVKTNESIHGVMFKGVEGRDTVSMQVSVPSRLARTMNLEPGSDMTTYFVGDKVKIRRFKVAEIYESIVDSDDNLIVFAPFDDLQRLNGWEGDQASAIEIAMDDSYRDKDRLKAASDQFGTISLMYSTEEEDPLVTSTSIDRYRQLYDWLDLIDFNVMAILVLMTIVAGFNMISGLLIMLLRNISTIGTLKALGMNNKAISKVFLIVASRTVLTGIASGNAAALLFCLIQGTTHLIRLNPVNYFVSSVPVHIPVWGLLATDVIAYAAIMLMLLIPCLFIAKVDPSETMRAQ